MGSPSRTDDGAAALRVAQSLWSRQLRKFEAEAGDSASRRQLAASARDYARWCHCHGFPPVPVSYESIAGYIQGYVRRQNGATHSVKNVKSRLRVFCRLSEFSWLSEGQAARVLSREKELAYADCSEVKKAAPLTGVLLAALARWLSPTSSFWLMMIAILFLGHDGLLRGGEIWSGIKSKQIEWHPDGRGFDLILWRTKTHRRGGAIRISYRESLDSFSAVAYLRKWFNERSLWEKPDAFIWTGIRRNSAGGFASGPLHHPATNKSNWIEALRLLLNQFGVEARTFSGHSLRVGGACDLFDSGVPLAWIMRVGRWKTPEAALEYYRDNHAVADEISRIFAECRYKVVRK